MISRRNFLRSAAALTLGFSVISTAGCGSFGNDPDSLSVGVKIDVPKFGYQNPETGDIEGLEVDIARELAKRIYGSADKISITGVNVTTRGAMLDTGVLDATLATFTITEARKKSYNFSDPYHTDYIGILVKKSSGITNFEDLDGLTIGVAQAATTKDKLSELAQEKNMSLSFNEYATYPEIKVALVSGRVDAFSVDSSILQGYLDDTTMLLDTNLGEQDYGIATSKDNPEFSKLINSNLQDMMTDGTLNQLKEKWGLVHGE
ncbi:MAG: substrate-binding domain-containing protein [Coriobacteriia bacterium]|nr:substrate-binding domain-containing protein [Coriobacteriia bacterium]